MTMTIRTRAEAALARCNELGVEATKIFLALDRPRILREADALDARVAAGESLPLAGLLCSIKDLFDRAGERTAAGSVLLQERDAAVEDAEIVQRLERAGALIVGRTNMTEFAYSGLGLNPHHGTPGAIFDRVRIPGGSSCGAALSVAHGIVDVAIGTDTGGSVRIPAAVNGLYGYKPSADSVPTSGAHPLSHDMDSVGPLAGSLSVALQVAGVLRDKPFDPSEAEEADAPASLNGLHIGRPIGLLTESLDTAVQHAYQTTLAKLTALGATIVDVDLDWLADTALANRTLISCEAFARYSDVTDTLERVGDPDVLRRIRFAEQVSPVERTEAESLRAVSIQRFGDALEDAGVSVVVSPTLRVIPPLIADAKADFDTHNAAMLAICSSINFVDGCAITLPHGPGDTASGAPAALMLAAAHGRDDELIAVARQVDALL